jgi:hypothetical protein
MATKRKNAKKGPAKPRKVKNNKTAKKSAAKKSAARKKQPARKPILKKTASKSVSSAARKTSAPRAAGRRMTSRGKREVVDTVGFQPEDTGPRSAGQSGDLQGISNVEIADSESVDELLEEGNAFEATLVKGIQDAPDPDESEVTTHEVPEDDVPGEYDDEDRPGRR